MEFFEDILTYPFLRNAVIAAVLAGVACGIAGTYIVTRRLVFLSGGITHSSFGGIGLAYYLGMNPIVGAAVFAVLSAVSIEYIGVRGRVREDSAIGILWSLGMAIGIIFVFLTPGYAPNLMSFLFGNILLVTVENIIWLGVFDLLLVALLGLMYRVVIYTALDRDYAATQRINVRVVNIMMLTVVSLSIVLNIKVVGIVLLVSLLTLPAVTANMLTGSYKRITILATGMAILATLMGLYVSYIINVPAGAGSVVILAATFFVVKVVRIPLKKLKFAQTNSRDTEIENIKINRR